MSMKNKTRKDEKPKLTEKQKIVLTLFNNGIGYNAISRQLDMSVSSVHYILNGRKGKNRKFKGIRHLSTA